MPAYYGPRPDRGYSGGARRYEYSRGKSESKKDKKMRKYLKDGKISKKEAKKLLKKGITERDIQRRYDKDFLKADNYSRDYGRGRRDRIMPSYGRDYKPLIISRGAGRKFDKDFLKPIKEPKPRKQREPRQREEKREFESFQTMPEPDEGLQQFDPVTPTNLSLYQEPITITNPYKKQTQGGLNQFKTVNPGLKISSKLLNI